MKLQQMQITRMVQNVFDRLKEKQLIEFKKTEKDAFDRAVALVIADFRREDDLTQEVNKMMDELEKQSPGGFDRRKMFGLLKQRLAKQKGIVL